MKKLNIILLTAALAAAACCSAACSKGQTGGGNNAMQGYGREAQEITEDCPDCENNNKDENCPDGNCGNSHEDCKKNGKHSKGGHMHRQGKHGRKSESNSAERRKNFEFDSERGMPHKRGGFEFIIPDGGFTNGRNLPSDKQKEDAEDMPEDVNGGAQEGCKDGNCPDGNCKGDCKDGNCKDGKDGCDENVKDQTRHPKTPRFGSKPRYRKTDATT